MIDIDVNVGPMKVADVCSRKVRDAGIYRIEVNGRFAGTIGFHDGASPLLIDRWSPMELKAIESKVRVQLHPQKVGPIRQPALIPRSKPKTLSTKDVL